MEPPAVSYEKSAHGRYLALGGKRQMRFVKGLQHAAGTRADPS